MASQPPEEANLVWVEGSILTCCLGKLSHNLIATHRSCWICTFGGKVQLWKLSISAKTLNGTPLIFQEEKLCASEHEPIPSPPSMAAQVVPASLAVLHTDSHWVSVSTVPGHAHSHQRDLCWGHPFPALPLHPLVLPGCSWPPLCSPSHPLGQQHQQPLLKIPPEHHK